MSDQLKPNTFKDIFDWAEKQPDYHKEGEAVRIAEKAYRAGEAAAIERCVREIEKGCAECRTNGANECDSCFIPKVIARIKGEEKE